MTKFRFALSCLAVLLLCLLGAGIYSYLNLPSLLEREANRYLSTYGLETLNLEKIHFTTGQLETDRIELQGERDGLKFSASLRSLGIGYSWNRLLEGQLNVLTVDKLYLSLEYIPPDNTEPSEPLLVQDFLPEPLIKALPVQSLEIKQFDLTYLAPGQEPISISGNLRVEDHLSLQFTGEQAGTQVTGSLQTGDNESPLALQLSLHDAGNSIIALDTGLQRSINEDWLWEFTGELQFPSALAWLKRLSTDRNLSIDTSTLAGIELQGSSKFRGTITHPDRLSLSSTGENSILSQFSATLETANSITRLDYPATVEALAGQVDILLELEDERLRATLAPTELNGALSTTLLSLPEDTRQWLRWDTLVPISWRNPQPLIIISETTGAWSLQLNDALFVLGNTDSELRWETLELDMVLHPGELTRIEAKIGTRLKTRLRKQQLPQVELALTENGTVTHSEFNIQLADTAESFNLALDGTANLVTGGGNYTLMVQGSDLPYATSTALPLLQKFGLTQQSIEIDSGSLNLSSQLKTESFDSATWQQQSKLSIESLSGSFDEYRFAGLFLSARWTGIEHWKTLEPVKLTVDSLNVGFEVVDIESMMRLPQATPIAQPVVQIQQFSAGMFGGRVYLPEPRQWDAGSKTNQLTLRAEGWRLADLVALQQGQDIQAAGILQGELPLTVADGRIIIEKGYLRAVPPGGNIRYVANEASRALVAGSPELGLALDLLSDFQYQVLSSEVALDKEGNLLLGLSLAGKNPARYEGRPINFNINLEQNLDPLLQSLRLSDNLVKKIESGLK